MLNEAEGKLWSELWGRLRALEKQVARLECLERAVRRLGLESCDRCGEWKAPDELEGGLCYPCRAVLWWECHPSAHEAAQAAGLVDDVRAVIDEADEADRRREPVREAEAGGS